ncbi:MAG: hypothetical protein WCO56_24645 [Verrucomicrobiota bacterium]
MPLYFILALICMGMVATFSNWRHGIYWMVAIAMMQDPMRKMTPGVPALLVLSIMPIWMTMILKMLGSERNPLIRFKACHARMLTFIGLFLLALVPSAVQSFSLGFAGLQLAIMGGFSYIGSLLSLLAGYYFIRHPTDLDRLLKFYCIGTGILLIGGLLEAGGITPSWAAVGTKAMDMDWTRGWVGGSLNLRAGFYRSPDIMGWHAAAACLLAFLLASNRVGAGRVFWLGMAAWASVSVMLCGRRKAFMMLPVFALTFIWINFRGKARIAQTLGVLLVALLFGTVLYGQMASSADTEEYYFKQTSQDFQTRVLDYVVDSIVGTFEQQGFWGAGLGTATQGAHHVVQAESSGASRSRMWQEGGLDRILGELGLIGFACAAGFGILVLSKILLVSRSYRDSPNRMQVTLGAFVVANAANFVLSHQVFGDPFISTFFAFLTGVVLSMPRLTRESAADVAPVMAASVVNHQGMPAALSPFAGDAHGPDSDIPSHRLTDSPTHRPTDSSQS